MGGLRLRLIVPITALICVAACTSTASSPTAEANSQSYPSHFQTEDGAPDAAPYYAAWARLLPKCSESASDVALYVDNAQNLLEKQHDPTTHLQVIEDIARAIPASVVPTKCDQIAAAIVTIAGESN